MIDYVYCRMCREHFKLSEVTIRKTKKVPNFNKRGKKPLDAYVFKCKGCDEWQEDSSRVSVGNEMNHIELKKRKKLEQDKKRKKKQND